MNSIISLLKSAGSKARIHGNGFIQLDITPDVRLHFWGHDKIPYRQKVKTTLHDHRWSFISYVLKGKLLNRIFWADPSAPSWAFRYRVWVPNPEKLYSLIPTNERVEIGQVGAQIIKASESYSMKIGQIHESEPLEPSVTLLIKTEVDEDRLPRVFVPDGVEPDTEFDRFCVEPYKLFEIMDEIIHHQI